MSIKDIFGRFWNKNDVVYNCYSETAVLEVFYKELAINSAINIIAKSISNAEFRTFKNKEEIKGHNYYLFNIEPNQNQNATEFNLELIRKLIYDNEALIIQENGKFYIADSYTINDRTLYQTFFTNVSVKSLNFKKTYFMEDVFYLKLNNSKIKKLIDNVYSSYGTLISQCINDYKKSKGIRGKVKITTAWSQRYEDQEKLQKAIQQKFRSYFSSDNSVIPMEEGFDFAESERKGATTSTEVRDMIEEIYSIVAMAFNIPIGIIKGDLAEVEEQRKNLLTFCVDPIAKLYENEINRKMYGEKAYINGSKVKIDTSRVEHINIFDVASSLDVLTRIGFSHNDLLRTIGEELIDEKWANEHYMTKNYQKQEGGNSKNEE